MKISLALGNRKALNRKTAWACLTTNQLALPGLGSIVAGRKSGYVQAFLAMLGLGISMFFTTWLIHALLNLEPYPVFLDEWKTFFKTNSTYMWIGFSGFFIFGISLALGNLQSDS